MSEKIMVSGEEFTKEELFDSVKAINKAEKRMLSLRGRISVQKSFKVSKYDCYVSFTPLDWEVGIVNRYNVKFGPLWISILWKPEGETKCTGLGKIFRKRLPWFPVLYDDGKGNIKRFN